MTGEEKKKRLKSDAVPSIFNFPTSIPVDLHPEHRAKIEIKDGGVKK